MVPSRFRAVNEALTAASAGWALLNVLGPYQRTHTLHSAFTVSLEEEQAQMPAINPSVWSRRERNNGVGLGDLPTQHGHHIQAHLLEDLPVFHLDDLGGNEEQDPHRHVAGTGKKCITF